MFLYTVLFTLHCDDGLMQGTHKSLKGNQNAKATVTAIIDGTGSIGAALGPLIFGLVIDESVSELYPNLYSIS